MIYGGSKIILLPCQTQKSFIFMVTFQCLKLGVMWAELWHEITKYQLILQSTSGRRPSLKMLWNNVQSQSPIWLWMMFGPRLLPFDCDL